MIIVADFCYNRFGCCDLYFNFTTCWYLMPNTSCQQYMLVEIGRIDCTENLPPWQSMDATCMPNSSCNFALQREERDQTQGHVSPHIPPIPDSLNADRQPLLSTFCAHEQNLKMFISKHPHHLGPSGTSGKGRELIKSLMAFDYLRQYKILR